MSSQTATPDTRRRPSRTVVLAGIAILAIVAGGIVWQAGGTDAVPYDDAQSSGLLTLCDEKGKPVTGGKLDAKPFAPIVVGESPIDSRIGDDVTGVATLFGYQPREGVDPLEFSGAAIGGPVPFVDHDVPATRIVAEAYSVGDFTEIYPARLDGYVQLRLITSAAGFGTDISSYDTADIKVDGDSWRLVRGGDASCSGAASLLAD